MNQSRHSSFVRGGGWRGPTLVSVIVASAILGASASGALLAEHDGGWSTASTPSVPGLCDSPGRSKGTCSEVIDSRWGSFDFFLRSRRVLIPTSFVGVAYFTTVALWFAMLGRIPADGRRLWCLTLAGLCLGLVGSAGLTGLMAFSIGAWCRLCVVAHVCNAAILIGACLLWRDERRRAAAFDGTVEDAEKAVSPSTSRVVVPRARLAAWAVAGSAAAALAVWFQFDTTLEVRRQWRKLADLRGVIDSLQSDRGFVLREFHAQATVDIPADPGATARLASDASAAIPRLVVFTDYDESACACFDARRPSLIDVAFPLGLQIEYRHGPAPRDGAAATERASGADRNEGVSLAALAAEAARMQRPQEGLEDMRRLLLRSRHDPQGRDWTELARVAHLDVDRFVRDLRGAEAARRVRDDLALAARLGVTSTPVAFLNGRRVPDLCLSSAVFWSAVARETAGGPVGTPESRAATRWVSEEPAVP